CRARSFDGSRWAEPGLPPSLLLRGSTLMAGNASQAGRSFRGRHDDLWYFDQLPPTARQALAEAAFEWSSGSIHVAWRRGRPGYKTGADIAARVAEADACQIAKDRKRVRGIK